MKSFKEFLLEEKKELRKLAYRKHIHEYNHHTHGPHGGFRNPEYVSDSVMEEIEFIDDMLMEAQPEKLTPEESDAKVREHLRPKLEKMWEHHGPADPKPASNAVLKQRINTRFDELSSMHPKDREKEFTAARKRMKATDVGHPVKSNAKTDTAAEIPTPKGPNGQIPLGMAFSPDHAHHYTSPDASKRVTRNSCAGSQASCRSACLAKHGNYGFIKNQAAMQARTQRLTHNEHATRDHATLAYAALNSASKDAHKERKTVLMRGSVTDDSGHQLHKEAIEKHFGENPTAERHPEDKAKRAPVDTMAYTKIIGTGTIHSDGGPMVKRTRITRNKPETKPTSIDRENTQRRGLLQRATQDQGTPSYVVFNKKRPAATVPKDSEEYRAHIKDISSIKTHRRYEPLPSTPKQGEGAAYHHPDGHGRVEHEGKSYRYQDHPVSQPVKNVHGKMLHPSEHDARNADSTPVVHKTPEGKRVGHTTVAFATASTSNKDLQHSGFFHHRENVDKHGVYHDGHPAEMAAAGFKGVDPNHRDAKLTKLPTGGEPKQAKAA